LISTTTKRRPWPSYWPTRSSAIRFPLSPRVKRLRGFLAKLGVGSAPAVPYPPPPSADAHGPYYREHCAGSLHALDDWPHVRRELIGDGTLRLAALLGCLPPIARIAELHALRLLRREGRAGPRRYQCMSFLRERSAQRLTLRQVAMSG
jgi:hypothetical protein